MTRAASPLSVTERLRPLLSRPISEADRARAALLVLDWTGCAVSGRAEPAGDKIAAAFPAGQGVCTRIGAQDADLLMAALHNGCLGNVLEMDDVDRRAVLHAAPTIIPAALAAAQHVGAHSRDFLDAIVIGYEATIRIGRAVGAGHYAFWHNTATCGPFGAAAAACHLIPGSDLVSALGLAGTQAAGLWQTRHEAESMAKQLHAGHAAHAGVLAAILSVQGFQGPRTILEGEQGFYAAMCPGADPEDILGREDAGWCLHETSLKPYAACRHAHAAIDAALGLRGKIDLSGDTPILIHTYNDALKFCDRREPKTKIEAKFSIQHSVAVTLLKGVPSLDDFEVAALDEANVAALRRRILTMPSDEFNRAYPAHYGARITAGGATFAAPDAYGDPEYPMPQDAVVDKAKLLMAYGGMGADDTERTCRAALALKDNAPLADYARSLP